MQSQHPSSDNRIPVEDVGAAIREGRPLNPAHFYSIIIADEQLSERHLQLSDPVPTGRQILIAAGVRQVDEYSIYAILPSGEFEDLRLDVNRPGFPRHSPGSLRNAFQTLPVTADC